MVGGRTTVCINGAPANKSDDLKRPRNFSTEFDERARVGYLREVLFKNLSASHAQASPRRSLLCLVTRLSWVGWCCISLALFIPHHDTHSITLSLSAVCALFAPLPDTCWYSNSVTDVFYMFFELSVILTLVSDCSFSCHHLR